MEPYGGRRGMVVAYPIAGSRGWDESIVRGASCAVSNHGLLWLEFPNRAGSLLRFQHTDNELPMPPISEAPD